MITADHMILLGATARNTGKTALAVALIETYSKKYPVVAVKVITVHNHGDICPRGGKGCGICSGLTKAFDIREETGSGNKDTMLFRRAGARAVYLVRSYPEGLEEAMKTVLADIGSGEVIVCESNSVRQVVKPGEFIMIRDAGQTPKPSAAAVLDQADVIVEDYREYQIKEELLWSK